MSQDERGTHDEGPDPSVSGPEAKTDKQHTRRRLLKAATMAPVIYTLPAGAEVAMGSISCADPELGNVLEVTRSGDTIRLSGTTGGQPHCELTGEYVDGGEICRKDEVEWIYEGNNTGGRITTGSCWTSLHPTI